MFRAVALVDTGIRFSTPPHLGAALPDVTTEVYAVGSPLRESLESTVTKGIVSALRTDPASGRRFIQADVAVSPGSSGGPLFSADGRIIGISAAKYRSEERRVGKECVSTCRSRWSQFH